MNLDGFSMRPLVAELAKILIGGRVDKITQQNKANFTITVRNFGQSHLLRISVAPQNPSIHLVQNPPENLPEPPTFCMVLRKNLEGGRIADIRQLELDRVIFIDVDSIGAGGKIQTVTLAAELIGKYSNLILVCDGKIIDALKKIGTNSSRVRTVLPNQIYQLPPAQDKLDIFSASIDEIVSRVESSTARLDKAVMNACQGFGPQTVSEVVHRASLTNLRDALEKIRAAAQNPAPSLVEVDGKVIALSAVTLTYLSGNVKTFATISEMLEAADELIGSYTPPDKEKFARLVHNELRRATNKISVLETELAAAENADDWRIRADNLSTYRYNFRDHADDSVTVKNIYSETGDEIAIPLDRRVTIAANVQNFYKKYDKLKRSTAHILEQISKCRDEIAYLESLEHALDASNSLAEIEEIRAELVDGGYLKENRKRTALSKKPEPYRFTAPDGTEILIGKNNAQNDRLTFKIAEPDDIWLHTKEITGSHVIIRCGGLEPSAETLLYAAHLAAKFSKAAGSSKVPVDYTLCKFVKKPSGAKPGFVIFTNQRTIFVDG